MSIEHGIEYLDTDGSTFVSGGWNEAKARALVADALAREGRKVTVKTDPRFSPRPVRVMRKDCRCEWVPA